MTIRVDNKTETVISCHNQTTDAGESWHFFTGADLYEVAELRNQLKHLGIEADFLRATPRHYSNNHVIVIRNPSKDYTYGATQWVDGELAKNWLPGEYL